MQNPSGQRLSDVELSVIAGRYERGPSVNWLQPDVGAGLTTFLGRSLEGKSLQAMDCALLQLPAALAEATLSEAHAREVSWLQGVRHPHVVSVIDAVDHAGSRYLVLGQGGLSLGRLLHVARLQRMQVPRDVLSRIVLDALTGLAALHAELSQRGGSIACHEFGPDNIWIGIDGQTRLLDTGVGRALEGVQGRSRYEATWCLPYASPELVAGTPPGHTSDTYSACVVLWEILSNTHLFVRPERTATIEAILDNDVPPIDAMNLASGVDLGFVAKGLGYEGPERYTSVRELAQALAAHCPPATARCVAEWLHRVDPNFALPPALAGIEVEAEGDAEQTMLDPRRSTLPDTSDELTLIACDVTESIEEPSPSAREGGPSSRRQYKVTSVSPKLIQRLAEEEAARVAQAMPEVRSSQPAVPSFAPIGGGMTSIITSTRVPPGTSPLRFASLLLCGVAVGGLLTYWIRGADGHGAQSAPPHAPAAVAVAAPPVPEVPKCLAAPTPRVFEPPSSEPEAHAGQGGHLGAAPAPAARKVPYAEPNAAAEPEAARNDESNSPLIVVPRSLHPRINPLMTSKQVFSSRE